MGAELFHADGRTVYLPATTNDATTWPATDVQIGTVKSRRLTEWGVGG